MVVTIPGLPRGERDRFADRMHALDRTVGIVRGGRDGAGRLEVLTRETEEGQARRRVEGLVRAAGAAEGLPTDVVEQAEFGPARSRIPGPPVIWREAAIPAGARAVDTPYGPVDVVRDKDPLGYWHVTAEGRGAWRARSLFRAVYELFELGFGAAREPWIAQFIETCAAHDTPAGKRYQCPCCDCWTLQQRPGSYEICPVCWWEDCPSQQEDPTSSSGPNRVSLLAARANYASTGAAEPSKALPTRPPTESERPWARHDTPAPEAG